MISKNSFTMKKTHSLELSYLTYLPQNYKEDSSEKYPLLLFLHGMGQIGANLDDLYDTGLPNLFREGKEIPFITIMPQCPPGSFWTEETDSIKALVDHIVASLPIDESRIYITGLSMGGFGTYDMLIRYPEIFAAGIPICGGLGSLYAKVNLHNLKDIPLWIFHGDNDSVVSVNESLNIIHALQLKNSENLNYTIYPGVDHDSWTRTYKNDAIYNFLLRHQKK